MEIYKTNNKNIFYTIFKIDNKQVELDFVLTFKSNMYCDVFLRSQKDVENSTYTTVFQYQFKNHNFIRKNEMLKYFTDRQIKILIKQIKKAYKLILKIKFDEIMQDDFITENDKILQYDEYLKHYDLIK